MMPGGLVEAFQAEQTWRTGGDVGGYCLRAPRGECVFAALQLESDQFQKLAISRSKRLDIQIRNDVLFFSGAAEAGEIAAQRETSAIVDIHACARERRAWRARLVDVVVADVDADVHLENTCEDRDLLFHETLLVESQSRIVGDRIRRWHHVYEVQ